MSDFRNASLSQVDPVIAGAIDKEVARQADGLELIASENFVSEAVLEAAGSVFTNKYAEGYPGKRYYGGCEVVDEVEQLAIDRAKALFKAEHANVQPHSGAQANMAAYLAVAKPGDTRDSSLTTTCISMGLPEDFARFSSGGASPARSLAIRFVTAPPRSGRSAVPPATAASACARRTWCESLIPSRWEHAWKWSTSRSRARWRPRS